MAAELGRKSVICDICEIVVWCSHGCVRRSEHADELLKFREIAHARLVDVRLEGLVRVEKEAHQLIGDFARGF